jgi:hypothetical protein
MPRQEMTMRSFVILLALTLTTASGIARDCTPPHSTRNIPSGAPYTLDLSHVPGATEVRVEESLYSNMSDPISVRTWRADGTFFPPQFAHESVETRLLYYRVTVFNESDPSFVPCTWTDRVTILQGEKARSDMRHGIVPVAGSLSGAFGSVFRTSLRLMNPRHENNSASIRGRVVFHPAGRSAQPDDPSLRYDLDPNESVEYEDIVAALGVHGLGSLDIVPDDDWWGDLPVAQAIVYNDAGNDAAFGMSVPLVRPEDVADFVNLLTVAAPSPARERMNIGIRTAGFGNEIIIWVRHSGASERVEIRRRYPDDYFEQVPLDEFVGMKLIAGDQVEVIGYGAVVYAATTNTHTNDPVLNIRYGNRPAITRVSDYFR